MSRKRTYSPPHPRPRLLRIEPLESRSLLAVASFAFHLLEDVDGQPGGPLPNDHFQAGSSFFVEITAAEYEPSVHGLQGVALNISWDPAHFREIDSPFEPQSLITPALPLFSKGTLDNDHGTITNLAACSFPAWNAGHAIGDNAAERFALLHFMAGADIGESAFTMRQGRSEIATKPVRNLLTADFDFQPLTITVVPAPIASPAEQPPADSGNTGELTTTILPTPILDIDDSTSESVPDDFIPPSDDSVDSPSNLPPPVEFATPTIQPNQDNCDLATYLLQLDGTLGPRETLCPVTPAVPQSPQSFSTNESSGSPIASNAPAFAVTLAPTNCATSTSADYSFLGPLSPSHCHPCFSNLEDVIAAIATDIETHRRKTTGGIDT